MFSMYNVFAQIERRKSSVRRRYSTKYVVHHDYLGDSKKLFGTPVRDLASRTLHYQEEATTHATLKDPLFHVSEEQKMVGVKRSFYY
jgi:hypothetical protein